MKRLTWVIGLATLVGLFAVNQKLYARDTPECMDWCGVGGVESTDSGDCAAGTDHCRITLCSAHHGGEDCYAGVDSNFNINCSAMTTGFPSCDPIPPGR